MKYKLLGWNLAECSTHSAYLKNFNDPRLVKRFTEIQASFQFPMIATANGETGNDGNPIVLTNLEFPYDEFNLVWFDWELETNPTI